MRLVILLYVVAGLITIALSIGSWVLLAYIIKWVVMS